MEIALLVDLAGVVLVGGIFNYLAPEMRNVQVRGFFA